MGGAIAHHFNSVTIDDAPVWLLALFLWVEQDEEGIFTLRAPVVNWRGISFGYALEQVQATRNSEPHALLFRPTEKMFPMNPKDVCRSSVLEGLSGGYMAMSAVAPHTKGEKNESVQTRKTLNVSQQYLRNSLTTHLSKAHPPDPTDESNYIPDTLLKELKVVISLLKELAGWKDQKSILEPLQTEEFIKRLREKLEEHLAEHILGQGDALSKTHPLKKVGKLWTVFLLCPCDHSISKIPDRFHPMSF
jgi:hypothetical protein